MSDIMSVTFFDFDTKDVIDSMTVHLDENGMVQFRVPESLQVIAHRRIACCIQALDNVIVKGNKHEHQNDK